MLKEVVAGGASSRGRWFGRCLATDPPLGVGLGSYVPKCRPQRGRNPVLTSLVVVLIDQLE